VRAADVPTRQLLRGARSHQRLKTGERLAGGGGDLDLNELAGMRDPAEVDDLVVA
jgi:hypothetical protein